MFLSHQTVLMEIREWLDAHPKEVLILSFSHFLGLSQELHALLLATIRNAFTSKLCPKTVRPPPPASRQETTRSQSPCWLQRIDMSPFKKDQNHRWIYSNNNYACVS